MYCLCADSDLVAVAVPRLRAVPLVGAPATGVQSAQTPQQRLVLVAAQQFITDSAQPAELQLGCHAHRRFILRTTLTRLTSFGNNSHENDTLNCLVFYQKAAEGAMLLDTVVISRKSAENTLQQLLIRHNISTETRTLWNCHVNAGISCSFCLLALQYSTYEKFPSYEHIWDMTQTNLVSLLVYLYPVVSYSFTPDIQQQGQKIAR